MNMKKREPLLLKPGATLGIAAPAGPFDRNKFELGTACLVGMGFRLFLPEEIYRKERYLAGDDLSRAHVLNTLFRDPAVDGIICARGGYGALRILSLLDYRSIRENPKPFIGFSDISALHSVLHSRGGYTTFHGPNVTTLSQAPAETRESLFSALTSKTIEPVMARRGRTVSSGSASGRLSGGNLATLCHLAGTPFAPRYSGQLLFLEDVGEPHYKIDRMLTQMKIAGMFDGVRGIALGTFEGCGDYGKILSIVEEIFRDRKIPIAGGFPVGHSGLNLTLPLGAAATLDADRGMLSFAPRFNGGEGEHHE